MRIDTEPGQQAIASQPDAATNTLVRVWALPVGAAAVAKNGLEAKLAPDELLHANRFRKPDDRTRYIVAHAGLRSILSSAYGIDATQQQFGRGPYGKPALVPLSGEPAIRFNLSHSGAFVLVAASTDAEVGVDIEWKSRAVDLDILDAFCSASELDSLAKQSEQQRSEALYRLWTMKEALAKAHGTGLLRSLKEISIDVSASQAIHMFRFSDSSAPWFVQELRVDAGYAAAVACYGAPMAIRAHFAEFRNGELAVAEAGLL